MGTEKTDLRVFKPLGKPQITPFAILVHGLKPVLQNTKGRKILMLGIFNTVCTVILLAWCKTTNSMGLTAYTYLTLFDILSLATCLLSLWVEQQKPNVVFTFGYERFEVLAVFASTILAQLSSLFIVKESLERFLQQAEIHLDRFLPALALAFFCHLVVCYGMNNRAFNHVTAASGSSWLQEHVAEMSQSVCHIIPGLSTFLLPRVNPFVLLGWTGGATLFASHLLIEVYNYSVADTIAAMFIAIMVCVTMFPMSVYSGRILLQTTPSYIIGQLDKCLREASTLDGVLEFRNECFWTLAFGDLSGTVHVRVRRDANEQLVLAHIVDRLSNLVSDLTIQVFKDEWAWSTTTLQVLNESALKFPSLAPGITSTISLTTRSPLTTAYSSLYGGTSQVQKIPPPQSFNPTTFSPTSQNSTWTQHYNFLPTTLSPASARQPLDPKPKNSSPSKGINPPPL